MNNYFTLKNGFLKIQLLTILCCLLSVPIFSQSLEEKVDRLLHKIDSVSNDSTKASYYLTLSRINLYSNVEAANEYAQKAINHSQKVEHWQALFEAYRTKFNVVYGLSANTDSLLKYVMLSEQCFKDKGILKNKYRNEMYVYFDYGLYYGITGETDKQLKAYLKALKITQKHNPNTNDEAMLLNNIGMIYDGRGQSYKALESYQSALNITTNNVHKGNMLLNSGLIYSQIFGKADSAQIYLKQALKLYELENEINGIVLILLEQGAIHDRQKKYELAYTKYQKAEKLLKDNNLGSGLPLLYQSITKHFYIQEKYRKAIEYAEKSITIATQQGNISQISFTYKTLYKSYAAVKNYKRAFEVQSDLSIWNDSLNSVELLSKVEALQTEFEVEQKEVENKLLKTNLKNRQWLSAALTIALLFAVAWGFTAFRSSQQRKQLNDVLEQKVKERTKELEQANYELRTFNYIASHDIKEPIRVIGGHVGLIKRKLPTDLKENLSEYFDTIKRSTAQLYTLIEDFAHYTTMSKSEIVKKQSIDLNLLTTGVVEQLEETLKKYNGQVLISNLPIIKTGNSLLFTSLKNLVENGLKYNKSDKPTVNIDYNKTEKYHEIIVSDNGIGIEKQYHEKIFEMFKRLHNREKYEGSGIGLAIVKLSVEKLGGTVNLESDEGKGSRFLIQLPI